MNLNPTEFNQLLHKVGEFTKIALSTIGDLNHEVRESRVKEASEAERERRFIRKAAELLYNADFLTDEVDRAKFLKQAEADPVGALTKALEKVCKAADVTLIGSPARGAATKPKLAEYDPVAARAFGLTARSFLD